MVTIPSPLRRAIRSCHHTAAGLLAFLRRPRIEANENLSIGNRFSIGAGLFAISLAVTAVFGLLALPIILATDLTTGERLNEALAGSAWSVMLAVVLIGPLVEEIIFRGWLSGTWRAVFASALALGTIYAGSAIVDPYFAEGSAVKSGLLALGAVAIVLGLSPLDRGRRIVGFGQAFPTIFYVQAIIFGALHFTNYAATSPVIALVATLPLVACGLIWGYARIRLGFASAVMLHAAYNVPAAMGSVFLMQSN
ncbi:type II CAAX prenyl endopeptidase Rce1 family protein [Aurantiacibacter aquimixticola]|uniref:CPBP family intramembrane metalloprotease n=1 Tax=Aurantiacibacter aquimixticola TaxID=1958945 RepID=A0A419RV83_9SPHN|nr:CPBP family glutamic-type intramembrane protease [Aurantiacibacter aquimixticola]RJY09698.1 CPBP family intramembrane metalloprotease [Aurantiacibacter aquimixticola]